MKVPKVSISIITYNQEEYISACLDSAVRQVANFDFEIVVADDSSTDNTPKIISEYALRYPELIKPILRTVNLGVARNAIATINECKGQYIALLEGDDFWISDSKLQKQADFLDKNADCVFCFTNQYTFFDEEPSKQYVFYNEQNRPPEKFDLDYLIRTKLIIPNNTKVFRRESLPVSFPDWFYDSSYWDWILHIFQASKGKIGYMDEITLAYRRHSDAAFMVKNEINILINAIVTIKAVNKYFDYKYDYRFKNLSWEYHELAFAYLKHNEFFNFLVYYFRYILSINLFRDLNIKDELWLIKTALFGQKKA